MDAVLEGARNDLLFVPVAIDYEKVVEGSSYTHELKGGEKKPEDLKALLSAPKVLTERYGRIHLTFDGPISMMDVMKERGLDPSKPITDEEKKGLVRAIANRAMYGISRASTVTPHALLAAALLAHRRKGVSVREIVDRIQLLRRIAGDLGAPISKQLVDSPSSPIVLGPVQDAMRMFASEGFVRIAEARGEPIYQVEDERRLELSFYKNTLVNLMAGRTIVASALLASGQNATIARVREKALFLSRLFKFELIFKAGQSFDSIFDETLTHLERLGLVLRDKDVVRPAPESWAAAPARVPGRPGARLPVRVPAHGARGRGAARRRARSQGLLPADPRVGPRRVSCRDAPGVGGSVEVEPRERCTVAVGSAIPRRERQEALPRGEALGRADERASRVPSGESVKPHASVRLVVAAALALSAAAWAQAFELDLSESTEKAAPAYRPILAILGAVSAEAPSDTVTANRARQLEFELVRLAKLNDTFQSVIDPTSVAARLGARKEAALKCDNWGCMEKLAKELGAHRILVARSRRRASARR